MLIYFNSISSGGYLSLFAVPVAAMGPVQDAGRRTGIQMTILSFGALIGPPISGAIRDKGTDFHGVGLFAGAFYRVPFRKD